LPKEGKIPKGEIVNNQDVFFPKKIEKKEVGGEGKPPKTSSPRKETNLIAFDSPLRKIPEEDSREKSFGFQSSGRREKNTPKRPIGREPRELPGQRGLLVLKEDPLEIVREKGLATVHHFYPRAKKAEKFSLSKWEYHRTSFRLSGRRTPESP